VAYGIRYGRYADALVALDRIAGDPSLDARQKKLVDGVEHLLQQTLQGQQDTANAAR
jgi:hypothetical protein